MPGLRACSCQGPLVERDHVFGLRRCLKCGHDMPRRAHERPGYGAAAGRAWDAAVRLFEFCATG